MLQSVGVCFSSPLAERAQGVSTTTCVHQSSLPNGLVETKLLAPFSHNAAMDGPVQASDSAFSPKLGGDSFKSGLANSALDQAPQVLEEERPKGERPGLPLNDPRGRGIDIPPHVFGILDHGRDGARHNFPRVRRSLQPGVDQGPRLLDLFPDGGRSPEDAKEHT